MLDLQPATRAMAALVEGVRDDQLAAPTPCPEMSLAALLDHVDGLSMAFGAAATKDLPPGGSQPPAPDASRLRPDWRTGIPERLRTLGRVWTDPAAWSGMTQAGGLDLPAEVAGLVALDEVVIHGWDVAVASGQPFEYDPEVLEAVHAFLQQSVAENPQGTPGLFGPPVPLVPDAPLADRVVALAGRDPAWHPPV